MAIETRVVQPLIPSDLTACDVPAPTQINTERDAAAYVALLHQAAATCAQRMEAIRRIVMQP